MEMLKDQNMSKIKEEININIEELKECKENLENVYNKFKKIIEEENKCQNNNINNTQNNQMNSNLNNSLLTIYEESKLDVNNENFIEDDVNLNKRNSLNRIEGKCIKLGYNYVKFEEIKSQLNQNFKFPIEIKKFSQQGNETLVVIESQTRLLKLNKNSKVLGVKNVYPYLIEKFKEEKANKNNDNILGNIDNNINILESKQNLENNVVGIKNRENRIFFNNLIKMKVFCLKDTNSLNKGKKSSLEILLEDPINFNPKSFIYYLNFEMNKMKTLVKSENFLLFNFSRLILNYFNEKNSFPIIVSLDSKIRQKVINDEFLSFSTDFTFVYNERLFVIESKLRKDRKCPHRDAYKCILYRKYIERSMFFLLNEHQELYKVIKELVLVGIGIGNEPIYNIGIKISIHKNENLDYNFINEEDFIRKMRLYHTRFEKKMIDNI